MKKKSFINNIHYGKKKVTFFFCVSNAINMKEKHQLYLNGCIDVGLSLNFLCFSTQEKCNFYNIFFSSFRSRLENFSDLSISILVRWLVVSICISYVVDISNVLLSGSNLELFWDLNFVMYNKKYFLFYSTIERNIDWS